MGHPNSHMAKPLFFSTHPWSRRKSLSPEVMFPELRSSYYWSDTPKKNKSLEKCPPLKALDVQHHLAGPPGL
jgi:hypothetical protein